LIVLSKKLPDQLGLNCYAVSTHPYELVLEPPPKKSPGSAYGHVQWTLPFRRHCQLVANRFHGIAQRQQAVSPIV